MTFEEILAHDGKLVYKTKGISMRPMLKQDRDLVVIEKNQARLRRFDVAFYRRKDQYVLHRVIQVRENDYLIRGDNTYRMEIVPEEDILGVLTSFSRKGKLIQADNRLYRCYAVIWNLIYPLRHFAVTGIRKLKRKVRHE